MNDLIHTTGPTLAQLAENAVITWLWEHPPYKAKAISLAVGNEFEHGDNELQEWFTDLMGDADDHLLFTRIGHSLGLLRIKTFGGFDSVDWSVVRTALLAGEGDA